MTAQNNTQQTASGVAPRVIIGSVPLMDTALLLTVKTLNRRVAEQLRQGNIRVDDTLEGVEIVGMLDNYKIVVEGDNGHLYWIHQSDFTQWLVKSRGMTYLDANDETQKIPQLFAV